MSDTNQRPLTIGINVLRFLKNSGFTWDQMLREWIDNSLGASAKNILVRREGDVVEIVDDGRGCEDLQRMESLAESVHQEGNKASMYGIGGVMSQICAGDGNLVEVESVHKSRSSEIAIDWNSCVEIGALRTVRFVESETPKGEKTGTTIRIYRAKRFKNTTHLIENLGHDYSDILRKGRRITFEVNGETRKVEPFKPPQFSDRIELDFEFQGHRITGYCGVVSPGVANPYKGWALHWGYRVVKVAKEPAGVHLYNRIYGRVYLPESWKNINPTKDGFAEEPDGLYEAIGALCDHILCAADEHSTDLELNEATEVASDILTAAIAGTGGIKGRRTGTAGKEGSEEGTGEGSPHRSFSKIQPGDKAGNGDQALPVKAPGRIRVVFDETLEYPCEIGITGTRQKTMVVTLNKSDPQIYGFRSDPEKLAVLCCAHIAAELVIEMEYKDMLPYFVRDTYQETYAVLLSRVASASTAEKMPA